MAKRQEMHATLQELAARNDDLGTAIPWDRLTVNEWRPAGCDCVIWQYFDDDNPRTVEFAEMREVCAEHQAVGGTDSKPTWAAVGAENRKVGRATEIAATELGLTASGILNRITVTWQPGTDVERVAVVTVKGLNAKQVSNAQAFCDAEFGVGSIIVQRA